ncbi:MAG: hypothetical protein LQ350_005858 [Teloschistes chrysophthalmus]|nr:MAG: hypothetical protein LQ350_005858 [Niorma chrysophthalma]
MPDYKPLPANASANDIAIQRFDSEPYRYEVIAVDGTRINLSHYTNDEAGVGAAKKKKTKRDLSHRSAMKKSARQVAHKWEPHPVEILIRAFCLLHDLGQALGIVPSESPAGQALDTIAEVQRLKGALEEVVRRTEAIEKE